MGLRVWLGLRPQKMTGHDPLSQHQVVSYYLLHVDCIAFFYSVCGDDAYDDVFCHMVCGHRRKHSDGLHKMYMQQIKSQTKTQHQSMNHIQNKTSISDLFTQNIL